nr:hypothetical protein CFP56_23986 [Quercus suber]
MVDVWVALRVARYTKRAPPLGEGVLPGHDGGLVDLVSSSTRADETDRVDRLLAGLCFGWAARDESESTSGHSSADGASSIWASNTNDRPAK